MDSRDRRFWLLVALGAIALVGVLLVPRGGARNAVQDAHAASSVLTGQQAAREGESLKAQFRETSREWFRQAEEARPR